MPEIIYKEVWFGTWCQKCKHEKLKETLEPCNSCLSQCWNENTMKPVHYEEKE